MKFVSAYLNERQLSSLNAVGDILIGDRVEHLFSKSGCIKDIDRVLKYMSEKDLDAVKTLLSIFYFCPQFLLLFLFKLVDSCRNFPGPLGKFFRLIHIAVRALVFSVYYSQFNVLQNIGYHVGVYGAPT